MVQNIGHVNELLKYDGLNITEIAREYEFRRIQDLHSLIQKNFGDKVNYL